MAKHPIQPLETDDKGVLRFKANAIVQHLLDHGGIDLNQIARLQFSREDREQFTQLIGYSFSGASDLSHMSDQTLSAARRMHEGVESGLAARLEVTEEMIAEVRDKLREGIAELYGIHPDDLTSN